MVPGTHLTATSLARPALAQRMADGVRAGCLLVVAPAGYGKTLAVPVSYTHLTLPTNREV